MTKCPAPKRVISEVVDGSRRQEFLENGSEIVYDAKDTQGWSPLLWQEISRNAWRLVPDPIWDELWTKYRGKWRIIIGTTPNESDRHDSIAKGAPICAWIAVQFASEEEWMLYRLSTKQKRLENLELNEAVNAPALPFDPMRMIPCPANKRDLRVITDEELGKLPNSLVVYAFHGLLEPLRHERLTCGNIEVESGGYGFSRVTPDRLFDYLHTKYPRRWALHRNMFSFHYSPKLALSFANECDLEDFRNSWCACDVSCSATAAILHVSRIETAGESTHA